LRNLAEYPITDEERIAVLKRLRDDYFLNKDEICFGDITLVVLSDLIDALETKSNL
jgi:hypothetical protein